MEYSNKPLLWGNAGTEPTDAEKQEGFAVLDKVPAPYFNYFLSQTGKCVDELQTKLNNESIDREKAVEGANENLSKHMNNKENPHGVTKKQIGLDKVDNTADSEKSVAFASEAGTGRKVQYPLTVRFKGGRTEGTDQWTFDGSTSRSVNITADKIGAANSDLSNVEDEVLKEKVESVVQTGTPVVVATSADGVTYTATVDNVTELYNGMEIIIIPNVKSESKEITLNINGLGAVPIRRPLSFSTFVATPIDSDKLYFLSANTPCRLMYHANYTTGGIWLMADKVKYSAQDLYGTVPVESGGTGATTAEEALANLGGVQKIRADVKDNLSVSKLNSIPSIDIYGASGTAKKKMKLVKDWYTDAKGSSIYDYSDTSKQYDYLAMLISHEQAKVSLSEGVMVQFCETSSSGHQIGTKYKIFGEHNKPTHSYNGVGSTTSRTVAVGGIGEVVSITSDTGMALVTNRGAICLNRQTAEIKGLTSWEVNYSNGVLTIATDSDYVNKDGQPYWCQVL